MKLQVQESFCSQAAFEARLEEAKHYTGLEMIDTQFDPSCRDALRLIERSVTHVPTTHGRDNKNRRVVGFATLTGPQMLVDFGDGNIVHFQGVEK